MKGVNPAWANLPRRKCDDCGKNYKPKQPLREGTRGFCSDNCRKSYHKHGGAYRKLKGELEKMVERRFKEIHGQIEDLLAVARLLRDRDQSAAVSPLPNPQSPR